MIAQEIEKRGRELVRGGSAESDRIRRAQIDGDAVVRVVRRQVEQVARREQVSRAQERNGEVS